MSRGSAGGSFVAYCPRCRQNTIPGRDGQCLWCDRIIVGKPRPDPPPRDDRCRAMNKSKQVLEPRCSRDASEVVDGVWYCGKHARMVKSGVRLKVAA